MELQPRQWRWMVLMLVVMVMVMVTLDGAEGRKRGRGRKGRGGHRHHRSQHGPAPLSQRTRDHHRGRHHNARGSGFASEWPGAAFFRRLGMDYDNFGWQHPFGRNRDWWEGPHVCESEETSNKTESEGMEVSHHHKMMLQVCEESQTAYRCTSTIHGTEGVISKTKLFQCCHGFARQRGDFGCPQRLRMENLVKAARRLGLSDLLTAVQTVGLEEDLRQGNFTLFAPQDGAFPLPSGPGLTLQEDESHPGGGGALRVSQPMRDKLEEDLQAVLLGHVLPEPRRASSFADEEILETASPFDSTIRINFYSRPEKLTTANCVKVTSSDNMATNGVIHVVERVLPPVTSSLMELIEREEDFSFFKTALGRTNLVSEFKGEGQLTLFAPTNAAFRALEPRLLDRLLRGNPKCLEKVIRQHVLPHVICSTVIQGRAKSRNILGNYVNLTRTDDDKVFADDAQLVRADVMATNGVLHVIDAVLIPDDALDLVSVVKKQELTELTRLLNKAGVVPILQKAENLTMFAPTDEAFQTLPSEVASKLTSDDEFLRRVLNYHVTTDVMTTRHLYNNRLLPTLDEDNKIRINEYSSFPFGDHHVMTAQCVPIVRANMESCNGLLHVVDKVLVPPEGNVVDVLAADSQFSTLVRLLKMADMADSLQEGGPFTVFAPTNKAFAELGKETMGDLENDVEELAQVLKMHVYTDNLCCAGIFYNPWWRHQHVRTMNGHSLFLTRNRQGQATVNDIPIGSCDHTATNGVIHSIDTVLMPAPKPWYMFP